MGYYHKGQWKEYRDNVIESDGFKCTVCGRGQEEVTLQVHHTKYISGKLPWEYPPKLCKTLCKGCHAREHKLLQPNVGWEYLGEEDLGDLIGTCENKGCGASIRFAHFIGHPDWGNLTVGTLCCDYLTDSQIASNRKESQSKYNSRKARFIESSRWNYKNNVYSLKQAGFRVNIMEEKSTFSITIHKLTSKKKYEGLIEAKEKVFDVIESGELHAYLDEQGIEYPKSKKGLKK